MLSRTAEAALRCVSFSFSAGVVCCRLRDAGLRNRTRVDRRHSHRSKGPAGRRRLSRRQQHRPFVEARSQRRAMGTSASPAWSRERIRSKAS